MNKLKKNIQVGKVNFILILFNFFLIITPLAVVAQENLNGQFIEIKILDKVSSKTNLLKLTIGEEKKFQNLLIKSLKCKNSEFDDNPEITAYIQVKDLVIKIIMKFLYLMDGLFHQVQQSIHLITQFMISGLLNVIK